MIDYAYLKDLAKQQKVSPSQLIALSPNNDPFYVGTPGDLAVGEWFANIWQQFGYSSGVHLRRVHYQIISQSPPVDMPNGKPYENTESCWDFLGAASKSARYLKLVDPAAFVDRRNHAPIIHAEKYDYEPEITISTAEYSQDSELPGFPDLPTYYVQNYEANQRYLLEIWCEKTTMDDVLTPLCQRYGVNLVRGVGEMSITATLDLVKRIAEDGRSARIFYISDFDPAGKSMPVAVSRKAEYFIRQMIEENDINSDMRLFPIVLTEDQVKLYRLPRTPIKETEMRRAGFEDRFGSGATELDALEALRPGELARIVSQNIRAYFDNDLSVKVWTARRQLRDELDEIIVGVHDYFSEEIEELRADYAEIKTDFTARIEAHNEKRAELFERIEDELESRRLDIENYPVPEAVEAEEIGDGLYNSDRDYMDQLDAYKEFQGKN